LLYIGKFVAPNQPSEYKLRRANEVLDQFVLPNIGVTRDDRKLKAHAIIRMAEKVVDCAYDLRPQDDLDNYANKRIRTTGPMMEQLFRQALKKMVTDIQRNIEKTIARRRKLRLKTLVQPAVLTQTIARAVNTGIWNSQTKGVTRVLDRTNFVSVGIDFKKINSGLTPLHAPINSRKLHGTHWGRICCVATPDDEQCGLTKNMSTLSKITIDESPEQVLDALQKSRIKIIR
ncbi:MAG TPA: DNA-directed RNA polymerase subunit B, partial [archaeon]|nr:DNA-directed RNA polymerase subunit B [archaeon]